MNNNQPWANVLNIPVISTVHLPKCTIDAIHKYGDMLPWMTCAPYVHGAFISVPANLDDQLNASLLDGLRDLFLWAKSNKLTWLCLDTNAEEVPGLLTYD